MTVATSGELDGQQHQTLVNLAQESNQALVEAGQGGANRAFNLSCSITLLPGLVIVLLVLFFSRLNWVAAAIAATLAVLVALGLANWSAYTAKRQTIRRVFEMEVEPQIRRTLSREHIPWSSFEQVAEETLPQDALLLRFFNPNA